MKRFLLIWFVSTSTVAAPAGDTSFVTKILDQWHVAASKAAEEEYFSYFSANAVFLGTDPKERWTKDEFRKWAHPIFSKGKGWTIQATKRNIFLSRDKKTAWFDEDAVSKELGAVRGSGVLVWEKGSWKVAQYNLSFPIPNEKFDIVRKLAFPKQE
jgi:hypothetical protein